jgi:hypothetical protein
MLVLDEAKMRGEGEQRQLQGKSESKRKTCSCKVLDDSYMYDLENPVIMLSS